MNLIHRLVRIAWPGSLLVALTLVSCGGRTVTKETPEGGYSVTRTMSLDSARGLIDTGRQARMEGRYAEATEAFRAVYDDRSLAADLRAEALFELGQVHADLLNPQRDYPEAIAHFETLLRDFPDSKSAERASKRLEEVRKLSEVEK
jgi:tetratricopeptide (TPR) repeat protein